MANSSLKLAGEFDANQTYLLKGSTLIAWREALIADRVVPGPNLTETQTPQGRIFTAQAAGGVCILGEFDGDKIVPGYITGGGTSVFLEFENIIPINGDELYVEAIWSANVEDGVLLSGGDMTAASIKQGSLPNDDVPTASSPSGKAYIPLGKWDDDDGIWYSAGCGSISLVFCPGAFKSIRG